MPKKIKYNIDNEFVKVWFEGALQAETIADLVTDIVNDRERLPGKLKVLIDSRRAKFVSKPEDLKLILKKIKEHHNKFEQIKLTIILQNPYETAISILMQEMVRDLGNVYFRVFSTEQAAVSWLI
jgi:hypothetical protein